ncbi:MAG TPA: cobalt ECF transporter T component CbiQ [Acidimicrobiales bacterium]|nr:cobalt ECF transporter T component CbiQ [Acidimicrobiales bacterium]
MTAGLDEPQRVAPAWLLSNEVGLCPCGCIGKRKKGSFVSKTLAGASGMLRQAMFSEDAAAEPGLLQRVDPRVKLVSLLGLLVVTAFLRSVPALVTMYGVTLLLAVASLLPLGFFVKRVWLFIPLFTGIVVLPATLNVITPGPIVVPLGTWFGHELGVTSTGLHAAAIIVVRVATSISLVVLLTLTTPWNRLLAALRSLFVPKIFVLVLGMAYRYVFQLLGSVTDMYMARRSRTVDPGVDLASGRKFVAASAGALFGKTHALSEEVYMAMVSRGYDGNARTLRPPRLRAFDAVWVVIAIAGAMVAVGVDRAFG